MFRDAAREPRASRGRVFCQDIGDIIEVIDFQAGSSHSGTFLHIVGVTNSRSGSERNREPDAILRSGG